MVLHLAAGIIIGTCLGILVVGLNKPDCRDGYVAARTHPAAGWVCIGGYKP